MRRFLVITHPDVEIDPDRPVTDWALNDTGRLRARAFAGSGAFAGVTHIWSSKEPKARETAAILAAPTDLPVAISEDLGENDRSSTGYLPPNEFEAAADAFFAEPTISFRGWERAVDAQDRIATAVREIVSAHADGDPAIVTHGAVGTLLWCRLSGRPIDRRHDQPSQGHYWSADLETCRPLHGWISIS